MANKESVLSIVIRAVNKATAEMKKLTKDAQQFADAVGKAGKGISTALTLPITAAAAASIKAFADFEKGMANVSTLVDTSKESIDAMGQEVMRIGRDVPVQLQDLTTGLFDLRSSGVGAAEQFSTLENSAKLAVAGLGTVQQSADLVTSSLNAFQLQGAEAVRLYDTIFKTTKYGKTTIAQLSQGFGGVAGTVAASGTKLDEYLASVAALTTTGLPAAEAHTQLKAVIAGLTRETDQTKAVFKSLAAKDFKELIAKSGGLVPALQRISAKLKGNEARILQLTGSTEALNAILGLTGAQSAVFAEALNDMRTGTNAVDEAFAKQNATLAARAQRTKNALMSAGIALGATLAPAMEAVANAAQRLANWFASLDESTRKWVIGIGLVLAVLGPLVILIGKLATGVAALKAAIVVLKPLIAIVGVKLVLAFKALGAALMANPIALIIAGLAALAVAGYFVIRNWETVKAFFAALWSGIRGAFAAAWAWIKGVFIAYTPIGDIVANWQIIKDYFSELWASITGIFESAWQKVKAVIDKIMGAVDRVKGAARSVANVLGGDGEENQQNMRAGLERSGFLQPGAALATDPAQVVRATGSTSAAVRVDFSNAPRGMRAAADPRSTAAVDLSVGYQLGGL